MNPESAIRNLQSPIRNQTIVDVPPYLADRFPTFLENRRKDVDAILAALDKGDFETIRILGHNMIGTGRLYGLGLVTTLGPLIESAALKHEIGDIRKHAGELAEYLSGIVPGAVGHEAVVQEPVGSDTIPGEGHAQAKLTALIVDDSDATRDALAVILRSAAIEVVGQAGDGRRAIELCAALRPDLVFLDVVMPGMSGLEVLGSIRAMLPGTKIVMVTSISERQTVLQSRELGAYDYVLKPFDWAEIVDKIGRIYDDIMEKK